MRLTVIVAFDENYAQHAAVTITSLFRNTRTPIDLWILYNRDAMSERTVSRIESLRRHSKLDNRIVWHHMDVSQMGDIRVCGYWSIETAFRLFIPDFCPASRVLYLDVDTVVLGDLSDFYNQDFDGCYLAAVPDYMIYWQTCIGNVISLPGGSRIPTKEYLSEVIGLKTDEEVLGYFNTGVLLMNLDKMREDGMHVALQRRMDGSDFAFVDQDCFNIVLRGHVKYVPVEYNYTYYLDDILNVLPDREASVLRPYFKRGKRPVILHFTCKPWKLHNVLFGGYYWRYLAMTPWRKGLTGMLSSWREIGMLFRQLFSWNGFRRWLIRVNLSPRHPRLKLFGCTFIGPSDRPHRWDPYERL